MSDSSNSGFPPPRQGKPEGQSAPSPSDGKPEPQKQPETQPSNPPQRPPAEPEQRTRRSTQQRPAAAEQPQFEPEPSPAKPDFEPERPRQQQVSSEGVGARALRQSMTKSAAPGTQRPGKGFRRLLYDMTGGRYNPGLSEEELHYQELIKQLGAPIYGPVRHVAVWSQKGGMGKSTTSAIVGATLASNRTDKILALDVNPDGGSLALRVPSTTQKTILDLRNELRRGYLAPADFDLYVNHAAHRLDSIVLPPGEKPEDPLTGDDYVMISDALQERYPYKIIVTDCGTNLTDSVMDGVLSKADQLVVIGSTKEDEASVTAGGLGGLVSNGYGELVRNAISVIVHKAPRDNDPDPVVRREIEQDEKNIHEYYSNITSTVLEAPYDRHVSRGKVIDPRLISDEASMAYKEIGRAIVRGISTNESLF